MKKCRVLSFTISCAVFSYCALASLLIGFALPCAYGEESKAERLLAELTTAVGEPYFRKRDEVLADKNSLESILSFIPQNETAKRVQWILSAWRQDEKAFRAKLAYMDDLEIRQRGHIIPKVAKLPPDVAFFCEGHSSMLERSRKLVPLMIELIMKDQPDPARLWRKKAALGTIRYFGDVSHSSFCLDQVPLHENDWADVSVDTALVISDGTAVKDLENRSAASDGTEGKYSEALKRLRVRQVALREKIHQIVERTEYRDRYPDPFYSIARKTDFGVIHTLEKSDAWEIEWFKRITIATWQYNMPERVNLYGAFLNLIDISGNRDFKNALQVEDTDKILKTYNAHARELVPVIIRCLWSWAEILDDSRKFILIELLSVSADRTSLPPLIDVLTREKSVPVRKALCEAILRIAPADAVSEIEKWQKKYPDSKKNLDLAVDILHNLLKK